MAAITGEFISRVSKNNDDKKSCEIFCKIIKEISVTNLEIFQKIMVYISCIKKDKSLKIIGGDGILRLLLSNDTLDTQMIDIISKTQNILNNDLEK